MADASHAAAAAPHDDVVVDVLMTAYDAEATIVEALESMRRQTLGAIRIVVVDDGSTDRTAALVARLATEDPRIVLVTKPHGGIADSLAHGLARCSAPFVARFDADDVSRPDRLARQVRQLQAHPEWIAVASAARHVDAAGRWLGTVTTFEQPELADATWVPCREPYMLQPFLLVRRAALVAVGGYRACEVCEDSDLFWRLRSQGTLRNTDDVLGDYRWHAGSVSSRSIVRGRRIAFWSQLVGLSARRRELGEADLAFDAARLAACERSTTLDELCARGGAGVLPREEKRLRAGIAAKLLEVTNYRPFELERGDCRFIRRALARARGEIEPRNLQALDAEVRQAATRLMFKRRPLCALTLAPSAFLGIASRWAFHTSLPASVRSRIKGALRRA